LVGMSLTGCVDGLEVEHDRARAGGGVFG
jgi:hypothetical protein